MNDINALYEKWCERAVSDPDLAKELNAITGNEEEIFDRFYKCLEFGTAGLRGVIGAGTNRMNVYTVNQATQGLADYLNANFENPSVAIAYDSRIKSDVFAKGAAGVLAANGVKVWFYPTLVPTPMLSFAVRRLGCNSGIIITASHNPSKYNGFKCYDAAGYQMTDAAADETLGYINRADIFDGVKTVSFDEGIASGMIEYIDISINEEFYDLVLSQMRSKDICKSTELSVIYTPLNGAGNIPVREVLKKAGFNNVRVVETQEMPDGNFPTCPFPNPEIKQAFEEALKKAEAQPADLLLATDPDCDRVGIAVPFDNDYKLMTGNEVGAMLTQYLLSVMKEAGTLPEKPLIIKSFVTTDLVAAIAESFGAEVANTLTGFKYIGEMVTELEQKGEQSRFICGMEESYGYLAGTHARDKDAVVASLLICEMAAYYKAQGKSLYTVMQDIYAQYGMYLSSLLNFGFEGASGMKKMADMMESLRNEPPKTIGGLDVEYVSDYKASETLCCATDEKTAITLPKSNVLQYKLPSGSGVIVRPSGTEPKIKIYLTACGESLADAQKLTDALAADMKKYLCIE